MSSKKRGLGKGLGELLANTLGEIEEAVSVSEGSVEDSNTSALPAPALNREKLVSLSVEAIKAGPFQPRNTINDEGIEQLADSIRTQGVIQPILVRKNIGGAYYEILAGERRWRASKKAGLEYIPAIIKDVTDDAAMAIGLIENIQREDLNPVEEAKALKKLADDLSLTHLQVAEMVGKSRASVTNLIRLLSLNPDVQGMLARQEIEMGHARALLGVRGHLQSQMAKTVVQRGLSVRETERIISRLQEVETDEVLFNTREDPDIRRLEQDLAEKLGAAVTIRHSGKGKGTVVIRYSNTEELDGILAHIQ
jgi:ParB family chromosome partitioning protein